MRNTIKTIQIIGEETCLNLFFFHDVEISILSPPPLELWLFSGRSQPC
jgi:hypothetical protein